MRISSVAFFVACASSQAFAWDTIKDVVKAFEDANIPENLAINFNPEAILDVTFPQGPDAEPITLSAGVQLPRNATRGPPSYRIRGLRDEDGPFVIATVDPDAPTPQDPWAAQIRHYLGGNFVRQGWRGALENTTAAVTEWLQPGPPAGSDAHRYIFLLFKQPEGFNEQDVVTPTTTLRSFNISGFAEAVGLGEPFAGTFMRVAPDPPAPSSSE